MQESSGINCANRLGRSPTPAIAVFGVAAIIGLVLWLLFRQGGGDVMNFVHWPSIAVVCAIPLMILTSIFGWAAPIDAILYVTGHRKDAVVAREAAQFFQLWAAFALAIGFMGTVVGLVVMLANLNDPSRIGPGMAVALLCQLYGVCIAVVCIACAVLILRRHQNAEAMQRLTRQAVAGAGVTLVAGTMATLVAFGILLLSLMHAA